MFSIYFDYLKQFIQIVYDSIGSLRSAKILLKIKLFQTSVSLNYFRK